MLNKSGIRGTRIVFSCTWYEKKKKAIEQLKSATLKYLLLGFRKTIYAEGIQLIKVRAIEARTRNPESNFCYHLTKMSETHQNVATYNLGFEWLKFKFF